MRSILATDAGAIEEATAVLDEKRLAVVPTDTLYALAADALDEEAVLEVFRAKRRAADQALPVCVGSFEQALQHVAMPSSLANVMADRFWPGPVTLVMRARPWLPDALTAGEPTVAVRVPASEFARKLASHFGPFVVTSANVSGKAAASTIEDARDQLGAAAAIYVDGGPLRGTPSTIVDCTAADGGPPRVLREGAVRAAEVLAIGREGDRELSQGG